MDDGKGVKHPPPVLQSNEGWSADAFVPPAKTFLQQRLKNDSVGNMENVSEHRGCKAFSG